MFEDDTNTLKRNRILELWEALIEMPNAPFCAIFFPLTPYPGTIVFDKYLDPALVSKNVGDWEIFLMTENESGFSLNKQFSGEEVNKIAQCWNRKFYVRPKQWLHMLKTMTSPMDFYRLEMGGTYLLQNYLVKR